MLRGALLPSVVFGTFGQAPTDRERAVRNAFRDAGFREQPDFRGRLWIHFVSDAGLHSQGLRLGSSADLVGTTGDLQRHRAGVSGFRAPTWLTHSDPDAEEPRAICRDTLAEARRWGVAVPRLEAAEPHFARERQNPA